MDGAPPLYAAFDRTAPLYHYTAGSGIIAAVVAVAAVVIAAFPPAAAAAALSVVCAKWLWIVIFGQVLATHALAYLAAPREAAALAAVVASAIAEIETDDRDVAALPASIADRIRLNSALAEVQKAGRELAEELERIMADGGDRLGVAARLLWPSRKVALDQRLVRLSLMRVRFMWVRLGVIANRPAQGPGHCYCAHHPTFAVADAAAAAREDAESVGLLANRIRPPKPPLDGMAKRRQSPPLPPPRPPPRHGQIPPAGLGLEIHTDHHAHGTGWAGVVQELQRSPMMRDRHASVERAMRKPTI